MPWKPEPDGSLLFVPVEVAGDRLATRTRLATSAGSGAVYLATVGQHGDATTVVLRPADARRLGTALIESAAMASSETWLMP